MEGNFLDYLRPVTSIMSNKIYQDKYNTFRSLNRLGKKNILWTGKESCTVILRTDCVNKGNVIIDKVIKVFQVKNVETVQCKFEIFPRFSL